MLLSHPNIQRVRLHERTRRNGENENTLIVETNLKLPKPGISAHCSDFNALIEYLTSLSQSEFSDFNRLEIREFKDSSHSLKEGVVA